MSSCGQKLAARLTRTETRNGYLSGYGIYAMVAGVSMFFGIIAMVVWVLALVFSPLWSYTSSSTDGFGDLLYFLVIVEALGLAFGCVLLVLGALSWLISWRIAVAWVIVDVPMDTPLLARETNVHDIIVV